MSQGKTAGRVLLALDLSAESRAAAELAVELAAALEVEVEGLFVEDRELLDLAGHPLAREVATFEVVAQPVERIGLERGLRAQAARARALLAGVVGQRAISWSFRVVRGTVVDEIRTAAGEGDTIALGRVGWSTGPRRRLGRTVESLLAEGDRGVLVPGRRPAAGEPVVACYEGSSAGRQVLAAAVQLGRATGSALRVEVIARDETEAATLQEEAKAELADAGAEAGFHTRVVERPSELAAALSAVSCRLLIVPSGVFGDGPDVLSLVSDLDCPLLLVR
ncbi:MAG: universal stress protein [Solirubrobacterales bacterium]